MCQSTCKKRCPSQNGALTSLSPVCLAGVPNFIINSVYARVIIINCLNATIPANKDQLRGEIIGATELANCLFWTLFLTYFDHLVQQPPQKQNQRDQRPVSPLHASIVTVMFKLKS